MDIEGTSTGRPLRGVLPTPRKLKTWRQNIPSKYFMNPTILPAAAMRISTTSGTRCDCRTNFPPHSSTTTYGTGRRKSIEYSSVRRTKSLLSRLDVVRGLPGRSPALKKISTDGFVRMPHIGSESLIARKKARAGQALGCLSATGG